MKNAILFHIFLLCICCMACTGTTKEPVADVTLDELPSIFPDYADVTIPPHIAPLRFRLSEPGDEAIAVLSCGNEKMITAASTDGLFLFPKKEWNKLLDKAIGKDIDVKVYRKERMAKLPHFSVACICRPDRRISGLPIDRTGI